MTLRPAVTMAMSSCTAKRSKHSGAREKFDPFIKIPSGQAGTSSSKRGRCKACMPHRNQLYPCSYICRLIVGVILTEAYRLQQRCHGATARTKIVINSDKLREKNKTEVCTFLKTCVSIIAGMYIKHPLFCRNCW